MQDEEKSYKIYHKIEPNRKYRIWRKDFNGKTYYNILVNQKNYDSTESRYYIPVTFKKGIELDNMTDIKIIKATENLRANNYVEDTKKPYCAIFSYMITEYEIVENEEQKKDQAYKKYQETLNENEQVEIDENQDLPF